MGAALLLSHWMQQINVDLKYFLVLPFLVLVQSFGVLQSDFLLHIFTRRPFIKTILAMLSPPSCVGG